MLYASMFVRLWVPTTQGPPGRINAIHWLQEDLHDLYSIAWGTFTISYLTSNPVVIIQAWIYGG